MSAPLVASIMQEACAMAPEGGVSFIKLVSGSRTSTVLRVRQRALAATRRLRPEMPLEQLARSFAIDHSATVDLVRRHRNLIRTDAFEARQLELLIQRFDGAAPATATAESLLAEARALMQRAMAMLEEVNATTRAQVT